MSCGQCGNKFVIVDPKRYGCSGWLYRGRAVCTNTIKVPRAIVESALLAATQRDLFTEEGFAVFKQEVVRLLAERGRTQAPEQERARRRLDQVEKELANIISAIKQGLLTPSTKAELQRAEAERDRLQRLLNVHTAKANSVAHVIPNLKDRFRSLVENLATDAHQQVDKARAALKGLLGQTIVLHPCADGDERFLTAELSGNYAGLLQLTLGKNKGGGGHPILPSLTEMLSFEIHGVALVA